MSGKTKFHGPLATPIVREDHGRWFEFSDELRTLVMSGNVSRKETADQESRRAIAKEERRVALEITRKMGLLAAQLDAKRNGRPDWKLLATRLAEELGVRGLRVIQEKPRLGRPSQNKFEMLYFEVQKELKRKLRPLSEVFNFLATHNPKYKGETGASLKPRYHEARRKREIKIAANAAYAAKMKKPVRK